MENKLEKKYGLFTAICMVVGIVVGSGVFFKAQVILQKTGGDMPLGVLAWRIGGALMIVCILAFSTGAIRVSAAEADASDAALTVETESGYTTGFGIGLLGAALVLCSILLPHFLAMPAVQAKLHRVPRLPLLWNRIFRAPARKAA